MRRCDKAMRDTVIFVVILSLIIAAIFALVFFVMPRLR